MTENETPKTEPAADLDTESLDNVVGGALSGVSTDLQASEQKNKRAESSQK